MTLIPDPPKQSLDLEPQSQEEDTKTVSSENTPPKSKGKLSGWILATLLLGGGGIALWQILIPKSAPVAQTVEQTPPPKAVTTTVLASGSANRQIKLLGQVEAGERATLSPQIDGKVQRV